MAHHDHHHGVNHTHDSHAFDSGDYHGQVTIGNQHHTVAFNLHFKDGHISGHGEDKTVGSFQLKGTYNNTSAELHLVQAYNGKHSVKFTGKYIGNHKYEGSYEDESNGAQGTFHLQKGAHHEHANAHRDH